MLHEQIHLKLEDTINYGSYYTPKSIVDMVYNMLHQNIINFSEYIIMDTSCGYGNFLRNKNSIGADFDDTAILRAKQQNPECCFFHHNSLHNVSRRQYNLTPADKLIIVGNPPYNDTTSLVRKNLKQKNSEIDTDLISRDLGVSFLLSYNKLEADYICVLHPLSYLIKKTNFESLKQFKNNYILIDSVIISSGEFSSTSKATQFPIIIALYKRDKQGMSYENILDNTFSTKDGPKFCLRAWDKLSNYITKYPNKNEKDCIAHFYTMRDINALKRSRTFIASESYNSIRVSRDKLALYCYADVFKEYIQHIPYYFGNSDIIISYNEFRKLQDAFMQKSLSKYDFLKHLLPSNKVYDDTVIRNYFKSLLGEYYEDLES
ncbi:MAG: SAM-dependent methyltransferase [Alphaproteobacteria bacterium]|jgi:hypothetical protein|nr:SAM-dependent methyltransferase [Alphaproteobacteria bacterium]